MIHYIAIRCIDVRGIELLDDGDVPRKFVPIENYQQFTKILSYFWLKSSVSQWKP